MKGPRIIVCVKGGAVYSVRSDFTEVSMSILDYDLKGDWDERCLQLEKEMLNLVEVYPGGKIVKSYSVTAYTSYSTVFNTDRQYAVYEDIEGQKQGYMVAMFANRGEAEKYAEMRNAAEELNG